MLIIESTSDLALLKHDFWQNFSPQDFNYSIQSW